MQSLFGTVKTVKLWGWVGLGGMLILGFGSVYGLYTLIFSSDRTELRSDQQIVVVSRGDLVNEISTNGSITFPVREILLFGTAGFVEEIFVEEGQKVTIGQQLAKLDEATIAGLEKTLAQARVNLQNVQDKLNDLENTPNDLDLAKNRRSVATAQKAAYEAQNTVKEELSNPTPKDIAMAESTRETLRAGLVVSQAELRRVLFDREEKTLLAEDQYNIAVDQYKNVYQEWLGITIGDDELDLSPNVILASRNADLEKLFNTELRYLNPGNAWAPSIALPIDDLSTVWNESIVHIWLNWYPGIIAPICNDDLVPHQGRCVKKEMDDTWRIYKEQLSKKDLVQAEQEQLVSAAETKILSAEDKLATSEEALLRLTSDLDLFEFDVANTGAMVTEVEFQDAKTALDKIISGSDPLELSLVRSELRVAEIAFESASERLENSVITASIDGVVSAVFVEEDQSVNPRERIVEIVDSRVVEVSGIVDEIDVLFVHKGSPVSVTLDALVDEVLEGSVSSISGAGQNQQGVVSYPIHIQIELPEDIELMEGLTATARIVVREERDVVLVPQDAVYGSLNEPFVWLFSGNAIVEHDVMLGISDEFWVIVTSGLNEGDRIVMDAAEATTTEINLRRVSGLGGVGGAGSGGQPQRNSQR